MPLNNLKRNKARINGGTLHMKTWMFFLPSRTICSRTNSPV